MATRHTYQQGKHGCWMHSHLGLRLAAALNECQRPLKGSNRTLFLCFGGQTKRFTAGLAISRLIDGGKAPKQGRHGALLWCCCPPAVTHCCSPNGPAQRQRAGPA